MNIPSAARLTTRTTRIGSAGFPVTRTGRAVSVPAAVYVAAWLTGMIGGPAAPAATASAAEIHRFYLDHPSGIAVQSLLIHGVAGLALAVLAVTIPFATGTTGRLRVAVIGSGIAAALVSLTQVAFALLAVTGAEENAAATSQRWFDAINTADTVKLVLLAVFVTAATIAAHRAGMAPRWHRALAIVLAVLLPLGGAAFLVENAVLSATLYVSLPLLLVWAGATGFLVGRAAK
jgi:hypothetical protein